VDKFLAVSEALAQIYADAYVDNSDHGIVRLNRGTGSLGFLDTFTSQDGRVKKSGGLSDRFTLPPRKIILNA
jgi:hypothetical protein